MHWTVSANTSVPGWRDGDVVLRPAVQGGEVAAAVYTAAVVLATRGVNRRHCVHHVRQAVVPGDVYNATDTVDIGNEGHERTGG